MHHYMNAGDHVVMFMHGSVPERDKSGAFIISDDRTMFDVQAALPYEAVDQNGRIIGEGTWFHVYGKKGDRITVRPVPPPKTDWTVAQIKTARQQKTVIVADQERHDGGSVDFGASYDDGSLDRVIASLKAIRESIPKQYRTKARCEIDSKSGYEGSHYARVEVTYSRPETDDEVRARLTHEATETFMKERQERAKLAALQAKYVAA